MSKTTASEDREPTGRVVPVNVGRSRDWPWEGRTVRTAFLKSAAAGPVTVGALGLAGDEVADAVHHGGRLQALYAYPSEHYAYWREALGGRELPWGSFGENLSLEGILEGDVRPGDRLEAGHASFRVTRPRSPCFKLNVRFARPDVLTLFAGSGRPGFYLSVEAPGQIEADSRIVVRRSSSTGPTIRELFSRATDAGAG